MATRSFVIPSVFIAVDRFTAPMARMSGAVHKFAADSVTGLAFAERGFRRLMSPIYALNRMLMGAGFYIGIYSFIYAIRGAIRVMADFQQEQVNISTVVDQSNKKDLPALAMNARKTAVAFGESASEVSELQFQLIKLGNTPQDVINMTPSITAGATAFGTTPEKAADMLGGAMKALGDDSDMAGKRMAQILYAADQTAADFESMATQLPIITGIAKMQNIPFENILSYLGMLRNLQIHTATGSTSLKNITLDLLKEGKDLRTGLMDIANAPDAVLYALKAHGKKSVVTGAALSKLLDQSDELAGRIRDVSPTFTQEIAINRLDSFKGAAKLAKSAYQEFILSIEDGTGKIAASMQYFLKVVSAMFYLSSNSEAARDSLMQIDSVVIQTAQSWLGFIDKIISFVKWILIAKAILILWRGLVIATTVVQAAFSIALGISAATGAVNIAMLKGNAIATGVYRAATNLLTVSQWSLNAAQYASPLIILAVGIIAATGAMKMMGGWVDDLTGGFLKMGSSVDAYSDSLRKIPVIKEGSALKITNDIVDMDEKNPVEKFNELKRSLDLQTAVKGEQKVVEKVSPIPNDVASVGQMLKDLKIDLTIRDQNGAVKSVKTNDDSRINVKTTSTNYVDPLSDEYRRDNKSDYNY